jgi:hypothetical protein
MEKEIKKEKLYAMLFHLGSNVSSREGCADYHYSMYCQRDCWKNITDFASSCGINMALIDILEGLKLETHPEIGTKGAWEKSELKEELYRLRSIGITPIPKYNFSSGHNGWMGKYAGKVGTPEYYRFCHEIIEEVIELFDTPEFFHLGFDEETAVDQAGFPVAYVRNRDKLVEDAHDLFKLCAKNGVRPWIWMDPQLVEVFGGDEGFSSNMPKEVLLSNWYYGFVSPDYENSEALCSHSGRIAVYNKLDEWGYEQMPTGSTYINNYNLETTMRYCKEYFTHPENLRGFLTAPWTRVVWDFYNKLRNEAYTFGRAIKKVYPEES